MDQYNTNEARMFNISEDEPLRDTDQIPSVANSPVPSPVKN